MDHPVPTIEFAFEATVGPHGWLARHIFVATGQRHPDGVLIRFVVVR